MNNKFQKGDRVRIISKSIGCTLEDSSIYERGEGIGYVVNANYNYNHYGDRCILVDSEKEGNVGDFFAYKDIELFNDPTKIIDTMFDDMIGAL